MLGEDHSLVHEFPQFKDLIERLDHEDSKFAHNNKRYTTLDREIRKLELKGSPIEDESMHQLKHDRSVLKDALYQYLIAASS